MPDSDSMGDSKGTPHPSNQKVAIITEMVGYNQNNDKIVVNEPYWWEKKGKQSAPHQFDWFFFSGHSFLYEMMMDQKKWSGPEMEAEILRRTDFLRWLFHQKKSDPAEILSELAAYAQDPIAVSRRCPSTERCRTGLRCPERRRGSGRFKQNPPRARRFTRSRARSSLPLSVSSCARFRAPS
jgi:hypothetical protein